MPSLRNHYCEKPDHSILKGVHVLVVEDTWHVAKALKVALENLGMHVSGPAATVAQAKRLVAARAPAIAVVDMNLKRELACGLIDELHGQGIGVVVVSGYAVPPAPAGKVEAILQKPFSEAELVTALQAVVAKSPAR
jgi:DNA-binding response OmpR family regulator